MVALTIAASALVAGCSSGEQTVAGPVTIYVSLPLTGLRAADGKDAADGARLALEQAGGRAGDLEVNAKFLDDSSGGAAWDPVLVGENARTAAQDSSTAAYIGELDSEPTRASLPITNEAGVVQISPGAGGVDLTRPAEGYPDAPDRYRPSGDASFVRLAAADDEVARAAVELAVADASRVTVISDGSTYGELVAEEMRREAKARGLGMPARGEYDAVLYAGGPEGFDEAVAAAQEMGALNVIATDAALSDAIGDAGTGVFVLGVNGSGLRTGTEADQGFNAEYRARFDREPGFYSAYGFEAMELALQGIELAEGEGEFRPAIRNEVLGAERADSVLGSFAIDEDGESDLCSLFWSGGLASPVPGSVPVLCDIPLG